MATARTVSHSRNCHSCDYCRRPDPALTVYKSLIDCCQHGATLQLDRSGWLIDSYDTRTTDKLYYHYLTLSGSDPNHREVGRQTTSGITNLAPATPTPAQISAAYWSHTHSVWAIPETRWGRGLTPIACTGFTPIACTGLRQYHHIRLDFALEYVGTLYYALI